MPSRMRNLLTPPFIAWRRCHPPLRGGKKARRVTYIQPISHTHVAAYPLIASALGTQYADRNALEAPGGTG